MRVFIALDFPEGILGAIDQTLVGLRREIGSVVRWVPVDNMHLTLKFLGEIPHRQIDPLSSAIQVQARSCIPFDMELRGLGAFPDPKRPRVLFLRIQAPVELESLAQKIDSVVTRLGYPPEARGFQPHLTVGRVKQAADPAGIQKIIQALQASKIDLQASARVDSVEIYQSHLKPTGAVYTKIFSARMENAMR